MRGAINSTLVYPVCLSAFLSFTPGQAQTLPTGVKAVSFYDAEKVSFKDLKTIWMEEVPSLPKHFWVLDQDGLLYKFYPNATGEYDAASKKKIADWSKETKEVLHSEYGAWGITFHNNFQKNGKIYTIYMAHPNPDEPSHGGKSGGDVVVDEWVARGDKFDTLTRSREIIRIEHKASYGTCNIEMGPDGYLYLGINDYATNSGDLDIFGRKILRLDIDKKDAGKEYAIPEDNPFVGQAGAKPEIWAYGIRNGWSMNFDALTGDLWLADVGQGKIEEMNIVVKGGDHGFRDCGDGACKNYSGFNGKCNGGPNNYNVPDDCSGYTDPEWAFEHDGGDPLGMACIAAGVTYRGDPSSPFYGYHIYGDVNYNTFIAHKKGETPHNIGDADDIGGGGHDGVVHYNTDAYGNIYVVFLSWDDDPHEIYRLDHPELKASATPLDYGCTDPTAANHNAAAVIDDGSCMSVNVSGRSSAPVELSLSGFQLDVSQPGPFKVRFISPAGKTVSTVEGNGPVRNLEVGKGLKGLHLVTVESAGETLVKKVFLH